MIERCGWCINDPLYIAYHDEEWGVPIHDDRALYEFLVLEGAQAGLSWITILKKREQYRKAFDAFDIERVARYARQDIKRLLSDSGIIRNRKKIESAISNARCALNIQEKHGSLNKFLWRYLDGEPIQNAWQTLAELPAKSQTSEIMSKDLRQHGFSFVGPTICYSFMQATGMINDHLTSCFRYNEIRKPRARQE